MERDVNRKGTVKKRREGAQNKIRRLETRLWAWMLFPMLALCLTLAGCAGKSPEERGAAGTEEVAGAGGQTPEEIREDPEDSPKGPVEEGEAYRDFTAVLADGSSFTLSEHEGSVILLNFWATWCGPCVREMPAFSRLLEKYGEELTLLAVNLGEDEETVKSFLDRNGYTFPVALDPDGEIGALYPSDGIPYTVVIGRDGKIACVHLGANGADVMYEYYCAEIDKLSGE